MHTPAMGSIGVIIPTGLPVWQTGVVSCVLFITPGVSSSKCRDVIVCLALTGLFSAL